MKLKPPPPSGVRILVGQGYYDNSIILNIFITTETQPKLTISFFSRPEKVPMRDMRISVHVLVHAGTMEKSTKWMKKWRPNPREKMAFLEIGLPKVDSLISVEPSPKFHNLWVTPQKKHGVGGKWCRLKVCLCSWCILNDARDVWKQKYELSPQEGERKTTQKQKGPHSERIYV